MDITRRTAFLSLLVSVICLVAGIICACVLKFNIASLILLGAIVISTVVASVITWRAAVIQNKNK